MAAGTFSGHVNKLESYHGGKVNFLIGTIKSFNNTLKKCYSLKTKCGKVPAVLFLRLFQY